MIAANAAALAKQRADALEAILEPEASTQTYVDFDTDINEPADLCYDELCLPWHVLLCTASTVAVQ